MSEDPNQATSIDTLAIHAGEPEPRIGGAVIAPIFQSANFVHAGTDDYFATRYVRLSNTPNHEILHAKISRLEATEAALVTGSGMAAIATALLTVLGSGDHLLCVNTPYGGTRNLLTDDLPRYGIDVTFIDGDDPDSWEAARTDRTRAIYMEAITNPLMQVPDLEAAVAFARRHGLVSLIDSTFASPVNLRPAMLGFDVVLHSATKYLNGHSDVAAGVIAGRVDLLRDAARTSSHLGGMLDPHACGLLHRGLKTLGLRVRRQNETALRLATLLAEHDAVRVVHYPGLASHPAHDRARRLLSGFGGMLAFEPAGGVTAAEAIIDELRLPIHAASLGGVESLVIRPAVTAYANVPAAERRRLGVSDELVRVSAGIEDPDELAADFRRALDAVKGHAASAEPLHGNA